MNKFYCTLGNNGVEYRHQESEELVFTKTITWAGHGKVKAIDYCALENTEEFRKILLDGIYKKVDHPTWKRALVRHGYGIQCGYYPVPLLFATEAERRETAERRGTKPPSESWVHFKREQLIAHYNLSARPSLLERIYNLFSFSRQMTQFVK